MRESFLQKLEKQAIVCDGAMGTMLYSKGISLKRSFDELSLTMAHLVKEVHLGYVKAGAEVLETNTFGANRFGLERFDLSDRVREINHAGARLAREVAGDDLYVAGTWPLSSYRNAEFMNNEVPGTSVPPRFMERMRSADTGERARAEGVKIAQETLLEIRDLVQGVQIAAPFGRYAMAVEVAQVLGKFLVRSP
jgi:hypothetical protein